MSTRIALLLLFATWLPGCVSIPEPLQGEYVQRPGPDMVEAGHVGQHFRWGGTLIEARPGEETTCIELLSRELDSQYRPLAGDDAFGRFRACHRGFLDPEIFATGREVTVVGTLDGFEDGQVGEFAYRFPVLRTSSVYLWPERIHFDNLYHRDPFWRYHVWPYWPYGGPYWIRRPVYVPVRVHARSTAPSRAEQSVTHER